jgi:hypothetical protein
LPWYEGHWEQREPDHYEVYLGRLGGWEPIDGSRWGRLIDNAEAITVYNVSPPYNRSRIVSMTVKERTIILNYERRHRLPKCISNLDALQDVHDGVFKLYGPPAWPIPTPEAAEEELPPSVGITADQHTTYSLTRCAPLGVANVEMGQARRFVTFFGCPIVHRSRREPRPEKIRAGNESLAMSATLRAIQPTSRLWFEMT